jgi:streptogramin lyase
MVFFSEFQHPSLASPLLLLKGNRDWKPALQAASAQIENKGWCFMKKIIFSSILAFILGSSLGCGKSSLPVMPVPAPVVSGPLTPTLTAQWGRINTSSGPSSFYNPMGIAVDKNNNVYVTDSYWNAVFKFDSQGAPVTHWGQAGAGNGQFDAPFGVAVGNDGNIVVADTGNLRVEELDSNGNYLGQTTPSSAAFTYPAGLAFDSTGSLYVSDAGLLWKFATPGAMTSQVQWVKSGVASSPFNYPLGLAVDANGNIYAANYASNKVIKFNPSSWSAPTVLGSAGSGTGQYLDPTDVKLDKNGNVYVVDYGNSRVEEFDGNGVFIQQWGNTGAQALNGPMSAAIDANGNMYVVDNGNKRVVKYALP